MKPDRLFAYFEQITTAANAIPLLRQFILDLAVRGKLVEQIERDEPIHDILQRALGHRAALVKSRTVRHKKIDDNQKLTSQSHLPASWAIERLGNLVDPESTISYGVLVPGDDVPGGVPFVRAQDLTLRGHPARPNKTISPDIEQQYARTRLRGGEILLCVVGSIGKLGIVPASWAGANIARAVARIMPVPQLSRDYLLVVLRGTPVQTFFSNATRTLAQPTLNVGLIEQTPIPLPPIAEQHRIVAKVDELMALCDLLEAAQTEREIRRGQLTAASLQRLSHPVETIVFREHARFHLSHFSRIVSCPESIPQLRQVILNLAVRGQLVKQDSNEEPASELLARIQEKKSRLLEKKLHEEKNNTKLLIAQNDRPSHLPDSWIWVNAETVCEVIVDCPHSTPDFVDSGIVCLDTNGFKAGSLIPHKIRYVTEETYLERVKRLVPRAGDVVFAREGSVGASVVIPEGMKCCLGQRVMLFRPITGILSRYFSLSISEPSSLARLLTLHKGIGAKHINVADMRNAGLALPPLAEQHRIVAKVDELMALCDRLEAQLTTTQTQSRRLLEAVLHEALAGA